MPPCFTSRYIPATLIGVTDSGNGYRFSWEPKHFPDPAPMPFGAWVWVSGGPLPCEVALRLHRHADGRYVFTGMVISEPLPTPMEITSQVLRQIRLSEIQAALFGPDGLFGDFDPASPPADGSTPSPEATRWLANLAARHGQIASGPSRGPDEAVLRGFALTYQKELARQPSRAMSTAAKAHSISRATANRWAALCRNTGLLPQRPGPAAPGDDARR